MRIFIADDQPKVRFALRVLLERQPGINVVGEATEIKELVDKLETTKPDVVLLGWELPGLVKTTSVRAMRKACPDVRVIALSCRTGACDAALAAGADAFVSKAEPPERLLIAIEDCQFSPNT